MSRKKQRRLKDAQNSSEKVLTDGPDDSNSPVVSENDDEEEESTGRIPGNNEQFFSRNGVEFLSDSDDDSVHDGEEQPNQVAIESRGPWSERQEHDKNHLPRTADVRASAQIEQDSDSSSEGDENPVGDIPMRWYDGYDHIGYGRDGERIIAVNKPTALELAADPHAWRRVYDEKNDNQIMLTHNELRAIARVRAGRYPSSSANPDQSEPIAWAGQVETHPLTSGSEPKRRFLPSRHDARAVVKIVQALREGKLKLPGEKARGQADDEARRYNFDVWERYEPKRPEDVTKSDRARELMRVPAPKVAFPQHDESYNPPQEYLLTKNQVKKWKTKDPEDRKINYVPKKYASLRHVPLYDHFVKERFERCLDLYLAVRVRREPERIKPEDLIPNLPSPRDLRPFPTGRSLSFGPLPSRSRSISIHPRGQWLISGSDDGAVRVWEVATGCLRHTWWLGHDVPKVEGRIAAVSCVAWCPSEFAFVFAASVGCAIFVVSAAEVLGLSKVESHALFEVPSDDPTPRGNLEDIKWSDVPPSNSEKKAEESDVEHNGDDSEKMVRVDTSRPVRMVTWHHKGDYLASIGKDSSGCSVAIHRLSRRSSQMPFKKKTTSVQSVRFHPSRPFFFIATMHSIRVYNLSAQQAIKTLKPGVKWISSMEIHPSGDHVLVGSYDKRLCWFDLDLSVLPYKTIRNHEYAVRAAKYHPRLPLFADAADDGSAHVFHGMVYDDLMKNALIVPLKKLERFHSVTDSLGILDIAWHPRLPWLFTSGADKQLHLFSDLS